MKDFDRVYGELHKLAPASRATTITEALPIAGMVTHWVIQTMWHNDEPVVFLQTIDESGAIREVLPGKVVNTIIRQAERLKAQANDRRSDARKARDRERERIQAARRVLEQKRAERRARRESSGERAS